MDHPLHSACSAVLLLLQDVIDGYLKPMRSHDWDRGSLLSLRAMSFPGAYPYETVSVPVLTLIGEKDTFLLKTAQRVSGACSAFPIATCPDCMLALPFGVACNFKLAILTAMP